MNREWVISQAHDSSRSMRIVRIAVSLILITHPLYAIFHPENIHRFGLFLISRHIPFGDCFAWAAMFFQCACSLMLVSSLFVVLGCVGHVFVLVIGIFLVHAPRWRTVGLPDGVNQPGAEFSVLLICCLLAILYAHRGKTREISSGYFGESIAVTRALEFVLFTSAAILIIHPLGALRDPAGLNDLGAYFSSIGFPFGVPLVWGSMFLQIGSSLALIVRRCVVPACLGHILVLGTGVWLFHAPHWFVIGPNGVIGPGYEGMEYSTLLITCFVSMILAYWPRNLCKDKWGSQ